jgi:hypothetical protein
MLGIGIDKGAAGSALRTNFLVHFPIGALALATTVTDCPACPLTNYVNASSS